VPVTGTCDRSFWQVQEAFSANFDDSANFDNRAEIDTAVCVMVKGRVVADLWGGWADPVGSRLWQHDTLVNVFSVGKGLVALCAARLCGQGRLEIEAPVSRYWPEFAAAGKAAITVGQLLSHQRNRGGSRVRRTAIT
jgi:CubicO group peptidase (beta-lactamase class C family)